VVMTLFRPDRGVFHWICLASAVHAPAVGVT
jgi:hypothetical protein